MAAEGARDGCWTLRNPHCEQRQADGDCVGKHMGCMGQQSQAARKDAAGYFNPHVAEQQNQDNYQAATTGAPIVVVMVVPRVSPPAADVAVVGATNLLRCHFPLLPTR